MLRNILSICLLLLVSAGMFSSCSSGSNTPTDPCVGKNIQITAVLNSPTTAAGTNGSLVATATGSTGFTYSINGGAFQNSGSFSSLTVGSYSISAKDVDGCVKSQSFTITAPSCPVITLTAVVTPATNSSTSDGVIVATATGSTGIQYSIDALTFQNSGTFSGLAAGAYTIIAKDANGCTAVQTFAVTSGSCSLTVTASTTPSASPNVSTGMIVVTVTSGTAPYTYSINALPFQSSNVFNGLAAGNYTVVVRDINNCLGTVNVAVSSNPCPTITFTSNITQADKCRNNNGAITVSAVGSTGFTYNVNGGAFSSNNNFNSLATGTYLITAKDVNGCTATSSLNVTQAPAGTKFAAVKAMMATNCATPGCHSGASPQNGLNFNDDCTIVAQSARIKARAVDGIGGFMPAAGQLSAADKQKITDWINAGGQHSGN